MFCKHGTNTPIIVPNLASGVCMKNKKTRISSITENENENKKKTLQNMQQHAFPKIKQIKNSQPKQSKKQSLL